MVTIIILNYYDINIVIVLKIKNIQHQLFLVDIEQFFNENDHYFITNTKYLPTFE